MIETDNPDLLRYISSSEDLNKIPSTSEMHVSIKYTPVNALYLMHSDEFGKYWLPLHEQEFDQHTIAVSQQQAGRTKHFLLTQ